MAFAHYSVLNVVQSDKALLLSQTFICGLPQPLFLNVLTCLLWYCLTILLLDLFCPPFLSKCRNLIGIGEHSLY